MDFRPIDLYNIIYKILANIICNRLSTLLPHLIIKNQCGSIKNKSMVENALISMESIVQIQAKNSRDIAIKLDLTRAFDRVE